MQHDLKNHQADLLFIYSLYSSEEKTIYFQYTAMLAVTFHLWQNGLFPLYRDDILIYDYLDSRRYLWEDKVFMNDINILRQHGLLKRARVRTAGYRDYNSHQITLSGIDHIRRSGYSDSAQAKRILSYLTCPKCRSLLNVRLEKKAPVLLCPEKKHRQVINGFLKDMKLEKLNHTKPFFL